MPVDLRHDGEDGGDAAHLASVVFDGFQRPCDGFAGRRGREEDEDVLAADHHVSVLTEDHLAGEIIFRRHDVDRAVRVLRQDAGVRQLVRQVGTDDLRAVHADDGVDNG